MVQQELLGTRDLTRYSELESYLKDFARGTYQFVWLTGRPGVGKSETIQATMCDRKVLYVKSGQVTPLSLYMKCYDHCGEPTILDLDDMDAMMKDTNGRRLLLALGETTPTKTLQWHSTSPRMGEVPSSFETSSPLCIIANDAPLKDNIRSRALKLEFAPTNEEIHRYAATWFWDQEIHDWFGRHLSRLHPLDLRWYRQADDDRRAGRDWADLLLKHYALDAAEAVVVDLEHDPAHPTRKDKERRFAEIMAGRKGASRANYHNIRKRLSKSTRLEPETITTIPVRGKRPPRAESHQEEAAQPPADLPQRDVFVRPITGQTGQPNSQQQPSHAEADDTVGFERPQEDGEDDT